MRVLAAFAVIVSLDVFSPALAQDDHAADTKALGSFALTVKNVEEATRANELLAAEAAKNPAFAKKLHEQIDSSASLRDSEAKLQKEPATMAILKRTGLSSHDFILTNAALSLVLLQRQVGKAPEGKDAGPTTKANLAFIDHHPQEVQAFQRSLEKLQGDEASGTP